MALEPKLRTDEGLTMKITVEIDCTPDEARQFLGLPDVSAANKVYVDAMAKAMQGVSSLDQLQDYAKQIAPMGQVGLKLFQQLFEQGTAMTGFGGNGAKPKDKDK